MFYSAHGHRCNNTTVFLQGGGHISVVISVHSNYYTAHKTSTAFDEMYNQKFVSV